MSVNDRFSPGRKVQSIVCFVFRGFPAALQLSSDFRLYTSLLLHSSLWGGVFFSIFTLRRVFFSNMELSPTTRPDSSVMGFLLVRCDTLSSSLTAERLFLIVQLRNLSYLSVYVLPLSMMSSPRSSIPYKASGWGGGETRDSKDHCSAAMDSHRVPQTQSRFQ